MNAELNTFLILDVVVFSNILLHLTNFIYLIKRKDFEKPYRIFYSSEYLIVFVPCIFNHITNINLIF